MNKSPYLLEAMIFDIDGTLANCSPRLHHLPDWDKFFEGMADDLPIWPIIYLTRLQYLDGVRVLLCSGRPEKYRQVTEKWLNKYNVEYTELYMRSDGDHRPDVQVKRDILNQIRKEGLYDVTLVVDDRPAIVQMWREEGLICLANEWHGDKEDVPVTAPKLTLMVGPSGAGKSTYLKNSVDPRRIVSSDSLREELCGDWRDQSRNDEVFAAMHAIIKARLWAGLSVVVDATNLRNRDRRAITDLAPPNAEIVYMVINRPMEEKRRTGGWRNDLPFDLLQKHENTFNSNLKEILTGDHLPNVTVVDLRS